MNSQHENSSARDEKSAKKHYASPQLLIYGHVRDLTKTTNTSKGANDGMNNKS